MTSAKALFLRKPLDGKPGVSTWWVSVVGDDRFDTVVTTIMADAFENGMTSEQMEGARRILSSLKTLAHNEEGPKKFPSPGIQHRFDVPKTLPSPPTTDTEKKA